MATSSRRGRAKATVVPWPARAASKIQAKFPAQHSIGMPAIGMYGALAYSVVQRRREIGVRMALGATRTGVLGMVLGQGVSLTGAGLALGLAGAAGLTQLMRALLFGVSPFDATTFAGVAVFVLLLSLVATAFPALRATRVDPLIAMREP